MDEFCEEAYDNARVYKERTKEWHERRYELKPGLQVILYNSRHRLFPGKLKSRWSRPFTVTKFSPYGAVEVYHDTKCTFKVNGQRLKHYIGGNFQKEKTSINLISTT